MVFAANYGTDYDVLAGFVRSRKRKLLRAGLEKQIPSVDLGPVLGSKQGETMDRTIAIPRLGAARDDPEQYLLASFHSDLRRALPRNLIAAVAVGGQLDHTGWRAGSLRARSLCARSRSRKERSAGDCDPD